MYKIDTLKLSANSKFSSGFAEILGVTDLTDVTVDCTGYYMSKKTKEMTIYFEVTDGKNFIQERSMTFTPSDFTTAEKQHLLGELDKAEQFMLSQPEFANAIII
jgi:hypothetical protein